MALRERPLLLLARRLALWRELDRPEHLLKEIPKAKHALTLLLVEAVVARQRGEFLHERRMQVLREVRRQVVAQPRE